MKKPLKVVAKTVAPKKAPKVSKSLKTPVKTLPSKTPHSFSPFSAWFGGIVGMIVALYPVMMPLSDFIRQCFFTGGAAILLITAILSKQRVFIILQVILLISSVLGFLSFIPMAFIYMIMSLVLGIAIGNLFTDRYFHEDHWAFLGLFGFTALAIAFSGIVSSDFLFNLMLAAGGIFISVYALIRFLGHKVWIASIWLILNIVFCINPILLLLAMK